MAGTWDEEAKAWIDFESSLCEEDRIWKLMDAALGSGADPGVAEQFILDNYAGLMDAALEKSKAAFCRWKEESRKALDNT